MSLADPEAVTDALERAPRIVVPLVREVPRLLLKRRPPSGKWSAHEHACHLAAVHDLFFYRLEQILASPRPIIAPYDPGTNDPPDALLAKDLDQALAAYEADRQRLVARLRRLGPEDWSRTAEHGEYSHYSMLIMFRHLALHDFFHAYRIEELLLAREWADEWRAAGAGKKA
jgi:DinB superfamily